MDSTVNMFGFFFYFFDTAVETPKLYNDNTEYRQKDVKKQYFRIKRYLNQLKQISDFIRTID